jgi:predicted nucleic-acid-binding Zn-ribbon protein
MRKVETNLTRGKILKVMCPDCKKETRHKVLQSIDMNGREDIEPGFSIHWHSTYQVIECQGCSYTSFRSESSNSEDIDMFTGQSAVRERLYPRRSKNTLSSKDFWNVPKNLRRIYKEVIDCYNNGNFTLCAAGLRTLIEGLCIDLEFPRFDRHLLG